MKKVNSEGPGDLLKVIQLDLAAFILNALSTTL